ncbi:MAG: radical SAM protein [Chloroflexi bacterium]|nr:radical SAM protein [Chloroflexota bacterium]
MQANGVPSASLSASITDLLRSGVRITLNSPRLSWFMVRQLAHMRRAARVRAASERAGTHVPPLIMHTITGRCNLNCVGCYARAQGRPAEQEISAELLRSLVAQADDLGVSVYLITGGEPFTRSELLDIAGEHPRMLFPVFTNGLLIDEAAIRRLRRVGNVVPLVSLEGLPQATDARRGAGVHAAVLDVMRRMREHGVLFGTSITVTRDNLPVVTSEQYVRDLLAVGCRVFTYVNYIPIQAGTEALAPTRAQCELEPALMRHLRATLPALFVCFPGNEMDLGGCLAAGRGLCHIGPSGSLEPCPFSPVSDVNLQTTSLREGLHSPLFGRIQAHCDELEQVRGSCILWENREWVAAQLADDDKPA